MDDDHIGSGTRNGSLDQSKADRSVWLMKCPVVVARSWQNHIDSSDPRPVSKVVLSIDPLRPDDPSALQFTMEMVGSEMVNVPKSYSLNMFKDFVPMSVFSENTQGKVSIEGKVEHKFDMKPHEEYIEEYGRLCRERTNKSMIKNRQIQVIDDKQGMHMRPLPGIFGLISANSKDKKKTTQPVKPPDSGKRTRRDRGELEDIMFKLFERRPNWTLKQLGDETYQPAVRPLFLILYFAGFIHLCFSLLILHLECFITAKSVSLCPFPCDLCHGHVFCLTHDKAWEKVFNYSTLIKGKKTALAS